MSPHHTTNVLVASDSSDDSLQALDCALTISSAAGAKLAEPTVGGKLAGRRRVTRRRERGQTRKNEFLSRALT
jgi:hypothetical protein